MPPPGHRHRVSLHVNIETPNTTFVYRSQKQEEKGKTQCNKVEQQQEDEDEDEEEERKKKKKKRSLKSHFSFFFFDSFFFFFFFSSLLLLLLLLPFFLSYRSKRKIPPLSISFFGTKIKEKKKVVSFSIFHIGLTRNHVAQKFSFTSRKRRKEKKSHDFPSSSSNLLLT